ncbi:hypothetical protein P4E94_18765 [Pontiellaceae bacterium B12219]|nr:hypothetical protein [Pontiellaceae bacterium B12219]
MYFGEEPFADYGLGARGKGDFMLFGVQDRQGVGWVREQQGSQPFRSVGLPKTFHPLEKPDDKCSMPWKIM